MLMTCLRSEEEGVHEAVIRAIFASFSSFSCASERGALVPFHVTQSSVHLCRFLNQEELMEREAMVQESLKPLPGLDVS